MVPIKSGKYEYQPESLVAIRKQLGLTQSKMAGLLDIPANTLWRWETGATKPDAESLAAIYSVAIENQVTPHFFQRRRPVLKTTTQRTRLIVMWDFQNVQFSAAQLERVDELIEGELDRRFKSASYWLYKAFASRHQHKATDELEELGWKVWEDDDDMDDEIIRQAKSDCGQMPEETTFVLITKDGDFVDLIRDLKEWGVRVYLMSLQNQNGLLVQVLGHNEYSQALVNEVGKKRWIKIQV